MDTTLFARAASATALLAGLLFLSAIVLWVRQSKWRFAFVGYTAFSIVLTAGLWALSLGPIVRTSIPGAGRFTVVYDRGSDLASIAVANDITPEQLERTLMQASSNLYSSGRYSSDTNLLTIRARTIIHPEEGITEALELGRVTRSLARRDDPEQHIEVNDTAFERLQHSIVARESA